MRLPPCSALTLCLIGALFAAALPAVAAPPAPLQPYPLGPLSKLSKFGEGALWNEFFSLEVERGFKVFASLPQPGREHWFGGFGYGGFITLQTPQGPLFQRFAQQQDGTRCLYGDRWRTAVAKQADGWSQEIEAADGYPFVWLTAHAPPTETGPVTWLFTGYSWAKVQQPNRCTLLFGVEEKPRTVPLVAGGPELTLSGYKLGGPPIILGGEKRPFQIALIFAQAPVRLAAIEDGIAITVPQAKGATAPIALAALPADMTWEQIAALIPAAFARPEERETSFGNEGGRPFVRFTCHCAPVPNQWGVKPEDFCPLPPSLADRAPAGALKLRTLLGDVALCPGATVQIPLDPVADIEQTGPPVVEMKPEWRARLNEYAAQLAGKVRPDGGFTTSLGRPFYDGLTCSALMTARPYLTPEVRKAADEAVRKTLDLWWGHVLLDGETGLWYFPEPVPAWPVIDYPEITATLLWPTVQYSAQADPQYPKRIAEQVRRLAATLPMAFDWSGAAFAHAGPEFTHIITESVIGGFVACCGINRLAAMAGDDKLAAEYAERAAFARESMKLLLWRKQYGEKGVVSEIRPGEVRVGLQEPWDYTMYTWFSFVPAFKLPGDDRYQVWKTLEQDQWWAYYKRSTQRCYDYAQLMAIARYVSQQAALEKLPQFESQPFGWDHFDSTPAYALMAYPWLAAATR